MKNDIIVKKYRHCKRYFITNNLNIEYCDRIVKDETKPCNEIGSIKSYVKKLDEDYPLKIYNREYKTRHARKWIGKLSQEDFSKWAKEAKQKLDDVRSGTLTLSDFEAYLKDRN